MDHTKDLKFTGKETVADGPYCQAIVAPFQSHPATAGIGRLKRFHFQPIGFGRLCRALSYQNSEF